MLGVSGLKVRKGAFTGGSMQIQDYSFKGILFLQGDGTGNTGCYYVDPWNATRIQDAMSRYTVSHGLSEQGNWVITYNSAEVCNYWLFGFQ